MTNRPENLDNTPLLRFCGLIGLVYTVIIIFWPTVQSMIEMWSLSSFRHGYLIPFIVLFLLWHDLSAFQQEHWRGSIPGMAGVIGLVLLWMIASLTSVQVLEQAAVIGLVSALVLTVAGSGAYRAVWFPLAYLVFALPFGTSLLPALTKATADLSSLGLMLTGIPFLREGMYLTLPGGTFVVADICGGLRYLNAGLALGVLIGHLMFHAIWKQALYVLVVAIAFVLTNGVRAFLVMAIASASDMRLLAGQDHVVFGWVLFLTMMLLMYLLAERYSDAEPRHAHD